MGKPYVCPVCGGNGYVGNGFYSSINDVYTSNTTAFETCRTCSGRGIVWSSD